MPVHGPPLDCVNVLPCNARVIASDLRTFPCNFLSKINLSVNRAAVQCPLLAHSGHRLLHCKCPLSGVKRTWLFAAQMSAFDPKRTLAQGPIPLPLVMPHNFSFKTVRRNVRLEISSQSRAKERLNMTACRKIWLGLMALFAATMVMSVPAVAQQQQTPNIVLIMGDDIGWANIGVYNQGIMAGRTPNLDRLASQGMRFTDYYAEA